MITNADKNETTKANGEPDIKLLYNRLQKLLGDDVTALLDFELPPNQQDTGNEKHRARTARYKKSQALQLAPDSGACRHATSNILLGMIAAGGKSAEGLFILSMKELIDAGYEEEESRTALLRLIAGHGDRRRDWQVRTRQRLSAHIAEAIKAIKA